MAPKYKQTFERIRTRYVSGLTLRSTEDLYRRLYIQRKEIRETIEILTKFTDLGPIKKEAIRTNLYDALDELRDCIHQLYSLASNPL